MARINTLLIANRGEIACRVMRTARRMGMETVAVYSDADAGALHVREADSAVCIGPASAAQSYLNGEAIIEAALKTGADAIHPGYGFLSENAAFADACARAGIVFVGPPATAIAAMGDKAEAKRRMAAAGVPLVPGCEGESRNLDVLLEEARQIGFPLLVKAAAGGGGRGMRRVDRADQLGPALESARREAENAFGSGALLIERLIDDARHVEIQIFADSHGNCIHLGERDCSAQRRHQKVIEEAPSPFVDARLRAAMGNDAVSAARAVGYAGAGTVEFIVDREGRHFFLEMNTRLQVEHPVTEMITSFDLVEWQLRVAAGEMLPVGQEEVAFSGHAVEARLYAEDPYSGFQPQTGDILHWRPDQASPSLRVDSGVAEGDVVSAFYDPMIAKLVAHGPDRAEAIAGLARALARLPVHGVKTNRAFLLDLLHSTEFSGGDMTTDLLDRWLEDGHAAMHAAQPQAWHFAIAALSLALAEGSDWFRSSGTGCCAITLTDDAGSREVALWFERERLARVEVDGHDAGISAFSISGREACFETDGIACRATVTVAGRDVWLDIDGRTFCFREPDLLAPRQQADDPWRVTAPVTGLVRAVMVPAGRIVEKGETLALIEAMKMETAVIARVGGVVRSVQAVAGEQAVAGDLLFELDPGA